MYILGLHGGFTCGGEDAIAMGWPFDIFHDASAVLLKDGAVLAGVAQERCDRIKHSNAFPLDAIRFCLDVAGISPSEIAYIAYPNREEVMDQHLAGLHRQVVRGKSLQPSVPGQRSRDVLRRLLERGLSVEIPAQRIVFVDHHVAHARAAFAHSGFEDALIYVRDGWGDDLSGIVAVGEQGNITCLDQSPPESSLGHFYLTGTQILGYRFGDEYKIMGLAPYGNPSRYRATIDRFIEMSAERPAFDLNGLWRAMTKSLGGARDRHTPVGTEHRDAAAAFQQTLESIAFAELRRWREQTGKRDLCLSGGVAQNSSLNGRVLKSGLFDRVFVPAAPDDGGLSLGAALTVDAAMAPPKRLRGRERARDVFWGSAIAEGEVLERQLGPWQPFFEITRVPDVAERAAEALAENKVIGWARGRSEFGPRALGSRSILADPRPTENRTRINQIVKQRESFRPFAPSVLDEALNKFFEVDDQDGALAFMNFVVPVREDYRSALGAITHVDGSARVQTVSRAENPTYWNLIKAFGARTGIPIVLNTSFNNNAEPIVETVEDALACFATTDLDALVLGDQWITKVASSIEICAALVPRLAVDCALEVSEERDGARSWIVRSKSIYARRAAIDEATFDDLARPSANPAARRGVPDRLLELWSQRLIRMEPAVSADRPIRRALV